MSSTVIDRARPAGHRTTTAVRASPAHWGCWALPALRLRRCCGCCCCSAPLATVHRQSKRFYPTGLLPRRPPLWPFRHSARSTAGLQRQPGCGRNLESRDVSHPHRGGGHPHGDSAHPRGRGKSGRRIDRFDCRRYANLGALLLSFGASIATGAIGIGSVCHRCGPAGSVFGVALAHLRDGPHGGGRVGRAAVAGAPDLARAVAFANPAPRSRCAIGDAAGWARCPGARCWGGRCRSDPTRESVGGAAVAGDAAARAGLSITRRP